MDDQQAKVNYLKKVTLQLESGTAVDDMDLTSEPRVYSFIYGVATDGITLFEKELFDKTVGDAIVCPVQPETAAEILGHLRQPILSLLPMKPSFFVKASITGIEQADNREVIQAIAAGTGTGACGDGCDCGCGC